MRAAEPSLSMLKAEHTGKTVQGKCLALVFPVTIAKVYGCFSVFALLLLSVVALSATLLDTRNWTFSHISCTELDAQLARFESLQELNFLRRYKGDSDHWIGVHRESSQHAWKWADDTEYNSSVSIRGEGERAYLNDKGISSARHYVDRKWICSKPASHIQCQTSSTSFVELVP